MVSILFNDNLISIRAQRGIARYFGHLVEGAGQHLGRIAAVCSPEPWQYGAARHIPSLRFKGSWRIGLQDRIASAAGWRLRPDVIFNAYYGNVQSDAAQVYPVYDMMHEMTAPGHPFIVQKRRCFYRAAALLPISYHTANDLLRHYPDLDPAKIHPIPLGVDERFFAPGATPTLSEDSKPYFLYVGHRTPYKNFIRLLDAFGQAKLGHRFDLVAISPSGASFTAEEERSIARHGIAQSVRLRFSPSDDELRATYARAFAFVYPSLYEGFGLPILEAFASGVLVCASNTASMPELGGEAALYFEPEVVDSIAATLIQAASLDEDERHARIRAGIERARFFTWERCVIRTMDILRELACEQRPRR